MTSATCSRTVSKARSARRYLNGLSVEEFQADEKSVDAVVRCLAVVGEAAKSVPREARERLADLPWREMIGLRDRVVHDYLGVDLDIVWEVVSERLPGIIVRLEPILGPASGE